MGLEKNLVISTDKVKSVSNHASPVKFTNIKIVGRYALDLNGATVLLENNVSRYELRIKAGMETPY